MDDGKIGLTSSHDGKFCDSQSRERNTNIANGRQSRWYTHKHTSYTDMYNICVDRCTYM